MKARCMSLPARSGWVSGFCWAGAKRPAAAASAPPFWQTPWRRCWRQSIWTEAFILAFIREKSESVVRSHATLDYKTTLQEIVQKNHEEVLSYRLKSESGPDHDKRFVMEVLINSNVIAQGSGHSKKLAEQAAAKAALELMGE